MKCVYCNKDIEIKGKIGRNDICPHCEHDLRCCKQCDFYDQDAYNECREVAAERIVDKDRANFCEFFVPRGSSKTGNSSYQRTKDARAALEALFKK
jgi:hypothetical protein